MSDLKHIHRVQNGVRKYYYSIQKMQRKNREAMSSYEDQMRSIVNEREATSSCRGSETRKCNYSSQECVHSPNVKRPLVRVYKHLSSIVHITVLRWLDDKALVPALCTIDDRIGGRSTRIYRYQCWESGINMFLGLLDPDPLIRCMDPDPSLFS